MTYVIFLCPLPFHFPVKTNKCILILNFYFAIFRLLLDYLKFNFPKWFLSSQIRDFMIARKQQQNKIKISIDILGDWVKSSPKLNRRSVGVVMFLRFPLHFPVLSLPAPSPLIDATLLLFAIMPFHDLIFVICNN